MGTRSGDDLVVRGGARESRATSPRIVQHVRAVTRDDAQEHSFPSSAAGDHDPIVPAPQVDPDLTGDALLEAATEVRLDLCVSRRDGRPHTQREIPILEPAHLDALGDVGAEDVDLSVDVGVEAPRLLDQTVASGLQGRGQSVPVQGHVLGRQALSRGLDRGVGQRRLQLPGHGFPLRPRQSGQYPLVDVPAVIGQAVEA